MRAGPYANRSALGALSILVPLLGCAAAQDATVPATPSPATPPAAKQEAGDIQDALAELERAERTLGQIVPAGPASPRTGQAEAERSAGTPCDVACAALGSMRRAASRLCGLTGASDPRCNDALARVQSAEARVQASCGVCPS